MLPTKTLVKIQQTALNNAVTNKTGTFAGYDDGRGIMLLTNDSSIIYLIPEDKFILNVDQLDLSKDWAMRKLASSCDDLYEDDDLKDTNLRIFQENTLCRKFLRKTGEEVYLNNALLISAGYDRLHTVNQPGGPGRPVYIIDNVEETVDAVLAPYNVIQE